MYYIEDNNKIILTNDELEKLTNTINKYKPEYKDKEILYTEKDIILTPQGEYRFIDDEEVIQKAKEDKYNEANTKAKEYLESGDALYEFDTNKHIEATDGNIGKFTGYMVGYILGRLQPTDTVVWNTKEDETVNLTQEQVVQILVGLGQVQAVVWAEKFPSYKSQIEQATTVEDVNNIVIDYEREE